MGNEAVVPLLLEAGADKEAKNKVRDECGGGGGGARGSVVCAWECDIRWVR